MPVSRSSIGKVDGKDVDLYTLSNANGLRMQVMSYGAIITSLEVPDRNGQTADVVLGFDTLEGYLGASPYFGATVGRVGNRIRNASFELEGKAFALAANDGPHHLHGGVKGWDKVVWQAEALDAPEGPTLKLIYLSPDGDEGYPGTVAVMTVYTLSNKDELRVAMRATTDRTTIINMVHHTYWNLAGVKGVGGRSPSIADHLLELRADRYTPGDPMVPTGDELSVAGTAFDFRSGKPIGRDLEAAGGKPVGYDHNFAVNGEPDRMRPVALLKEPRSGRVMALEADQPGVQFYSGNFLDGTIRGKGGATYAQHTALCLETQKFPNAINIPAWSGQVVLKPGQTYKHTMVHRFTAE